MASRFSSDITTSTDKDGLVITTAQKVLHVTCVNGLPWVWFDDSPGERLWSNRPVIRGMSPEGAAFRESAGPHEKTFEDLLISEKLSWSRQFILNGGANEEYAAAIKEYAEMKGGKILEDYNAELERHAESKKRSAEKTQRRADMYAALLKRHPIGSKLVMRNKTYRIKEYAWETIRCVQLGAYDIETTKEIEVLKYVVLAQDLQVDTALANAYLSGDEVPEEEQHG